jgi:putative ATP-binding cassette transporter
VVVRLTAATLFIIGPLEVVIGAIPVFTQVSVSMKNIYDLERRVDTHINNHLDQSHSTTNPFCNFKSIDLHETCFSYCDQNGQSSFTLGPINLSIQRGEILFLVGGNGCGKSTSLKIINGLYPINSGVIKIDNTSINPQNIQEYRELFSSVFSDFHLFDRLYGLEQVEESRVTELILKMELTGKTEYCNGKFSNLHLSTGQRKRLAMIVALLEDTPIYIFDEWTADQDPHFREHFYKSMLPEFKQQGKTVIVVSHDDRYWPLADRIVTLEYGTIRNETNNVLQDA